MISVIAKLKVRDGELENFMVLVREVIFETLKEAGCLEYDLHKHTEKDGVFAFIEKWETKEDLDAHFESEHFKRIVPQMLDYCDGEPEIDIYKTS